MSESIAPSQPREEKDGLQLVNQSGESKSPYAMRPVIVSWHSQSSTGIGKADILGCHVMERESFVNADVAALLNDNFIPIKVDREERPDIDAIYMNYVQATIGSGGWPLNVFLTPDLEPLFGGTYWPGPASPTAQTYQVDFVDILTKMKKVWREQRQRCMTSADEITKQLREFSMEGMISREGVQEGVREGDEDELDLELLDDACEYFKLKYDSRFSGFGSQPKFPTPVNLQFLLNLSQHPNAVRDIVGEKDVEYAGKMVRDTLKAMWYGGIKDQVGHGFARYSVTRDWSLPHFEKMLYDQAQLLSVYLEAYTISTEQVYLDAIRDIVTYLTSKPISAPGGGFYSSEDADSLARPTDSEKREGAFYVWTHKEFMTVLSGRDGEICAKYWNVQENGNVQREFDIHDELLDQNVLSVCRDVEGLAAEYNLSTENLIKLVELGRKKLYEYREKNRPRPMLDDKIVLGWNGLAISALSKTAAALHRTDVELARTCTQAAIQAARFIKEEMKAQPGGILKRVLRESLGDASAFAADYAFLIDGLINLYEATSDETWLEWADSLQGAFLAAAMRQTWLKFVAETQLNLFWDDAQGGFFTSAADQKDLIIRIKDGLDNAEPSTNGISARNLSRLGSMLADEKYSAQAKRTLHAFEAEVLQHPFLFASLMDVIVIDKLGIKSIVLTGNGGKVDAFLDKLHREPSVGRTVVRLSEKDTWLKTRNPQLARIDVTKEAVQVCENGTCRVIE